MTADHLPKSIDLDGDNFINLNRLKGIQNNSDSDHKKNRRLQVIPALAGALVISELSEDLYHVMNYGFSWYKNNKDRMRETYSFLEEDAHDLVTSVSKAGNEVVKTMKGA